MVNNKTNINVHRSNGNVVLEKNAQSIVDRKENQFRNSKYSKKYRKAYTQRQEKTSRMSRPCDEKGKARAFVDNRKYRRKKKQRSSKNKNTRQYSSLAGKKHCGDVCGCKRSRKVEGQDRLRLQKTRQLKKKNRSNTTLRKWDRSVQWLSAVTDTTLWWWYFGPTMWNSLHDNEQLRWFN